MMGSRPKVASSRQREIVPDDGLFLALRRVMTDKTILLGLLVSVRMLSILFPLGASPAPSVLQRGDGRDVFFFSFSSISFQPNADRSPHPPASSAVGGCPVPHCGGMMHQTLDDRDIGGCCCCCWPSFYSQRQMKAAVVVLVIIVIAQLRFYVPAQLSLLSSGPSLP